MEARDATKRPGMHRAVPTAKNQETPHVILLRSGSPLWENNKSKGISYAIFFLADNEGRENKTNRGEVGAEVGKDEVYLGGALWG